MKERVRDVGGEGRRRTVELWVVVESGADAYEDGVVHGAHPVSDEHGFIAAEDELGAVFGCDFGIDGLGKGEGDRRTGMGRGGSGEDGGQKVRWSVRRG